MNVISKIALIGLFMISLIGCDNNKEKFDRKKAMASGNAMMAPFSRYIKKQVNKTTSDGKLESIMILEYNKLGELLFARTELTLTKELAQSLKYDYENNKFDYYSLAFKVNFSDGTIIKNNDNTRIEYIGNNDNTSFKNHKQFKRIDNFKDGKLLSTVVTVDKLTGKETITWDGELPIQYEGIAFNENGFISSQIVHFSYDQDGALTKMDVTYNYPEKVYNFESYFSERNEYGDWTKAKRIMKFPDSDGQSVAITTREIEYW